MVPVRVSGWRGVRALALGALIAWGFDTTGTTEAAAQGPVSLTVLRPDGTATQAHLAGLSQGRLRIFDSDRRLITLEQGQAALLTLHHEVDPSETDAPEPTATPTASPHTSPGLLHLTDGQRLAGAWAGSAQGGEALLWAHPQLGVVAVPLEGVLGWASGSAEDGATALTASDDADVVQLLNGERLKGFLYLPDPRVPAVGNAAAHGTQVLLLAPAHAPDDPAVPVPVASVAAVRLATALTSTPATPSASRARVTLHDGTRLHAHGLSLSTSAASFDAQVAGQALQVQVPAAQVWRIAFTDAQRDVLDLAGLTTRITEPPAEQAALWGPGVVGASVTARGHRLAAPAQLAVTLPPGAAVVVGRAVLDLPADLPADLVAPRAAWAGCTLRISGDPEVAIDLDASQPQASFRVAVPAGATELVFTLDPGPRGPVLDTVRIQDALVLTIAR